MTRKLILLFVFFIIFILLTVAYNVHLNNRDTQWPDNQQIDSTLIKSIGWLQANQSTIEKDHNSALWWMLKEASEITDKPELAEIYTHYKRTYLDRRPLNIWSPYFTPFYKPEAPDILEMIDLHDYQIFFIYALSCDDELATEPVIQKQLESSFCSLHFLHPRCITHQQIGVRLLQKGNCGDQTKLITLSSELIDTIQTELTWDFRVGDAYLQRNLMLAEAGRIDLIKPVWIQRILEAQNPDGGWDDIHPIITLMDDKIFGLTSMLPTFKKSKSTFHATAQGIWLLSLLQQRGNDKVPTMGTASD
jgi:hypothetical protein